MEISTPLIFISLFLLACLSLFLVYKYGIKEKSYEEALAEQRQQTNSLIGVKPKPKEKKNKKAAKKSREKPIHQENETDESENVDTVTSENPQPNKLHVEFKEEPEEVPIKESVQVKTKRVKKVRPILVKKDVSEETVIVDEVATPIMNHFEENPPKDEFELLRSNSRDDIFKQEPVKEKTVKEKKQTIEIVPGIKNGKKLAKQTPPKKSNEVVPVVEEKEIEEKVVEPITILPQTNGVVGNPGKEKKKKKSEFNTRQQLTAERDGLINSVCKADLSKDEIQFLIDLLLNKLHEAPATISDWSEGKSDPIQKLKKQLAEKEKALSAEQEALAGVQAKLKEIRLEQQTEKSQLQQKIRGLEELVQSKQIEVQAANNRTQVNSQKLQQLQTELNAEILKTHKLMEDTANLQMQKQQFEVRVSQFQETDNIIAKLRNDVEELSAQNQHLRIELQQNLADKDQQQQFLIQMTNVENGLKQQIQQLEESHQELERNLDLARRQENDWKIESANLKSALQQQFEDKRRLEHATEQLREELLTFRNEKAESAKIISQLNTELQLLKEDQISQVNGSSEETKAYEVEILNLTNELASVKNELSSNKSELKKTEEKYITELESTTNKCSIIEFELEAQKAKNDELRTKNWKVMEALNAAESRTNTNKRTDINLDELRTKNWKVMEALNAAESRTNTNKRTDINLDTLTSEIHNKEQDSQKKFIQRLFPEIKDLQAVTSEDWQTEFGRLIKNYVSDLKRQQKTPSSESASETCQDLLKLQEELCRYKNIIDDTEGMLNTLQLHIEKEEIKWREQLNSKNVEIQYLKEQRLSPLQTKILRLEQQLSEERNKKQQISEEYQLFKSNYSQSSREADATSMIEKLSEEVNHLREQLSIEHTKNGDANLCSKAQSNYSDSKSTNGAALIEHCLSSSSSLASSVIEENSKKPKNKKKKKKVSTLRNSNICSNMGCQFLYCDGKSCYGN